MTTSAHLIHLLISSSNSAGAILKQAKHESLKQAIATRFATLILRLPETLAWNGTRACFGRLRVNLLTCVIRSLGVNSPDLHLHFAFYAAWFMSF